ncbi:MAG: alpha-glucan family phosphorylase [Planctomycetes bacterium]|nr:alpha-glucan family phosphorylase [Planctomycetota bacterium]
MPKIAGFHVKPRLPKGLEPLRTLAYNLHWTWDRYSVEIFRRLDPDLWESVYHNPVKMLGLVTQMRLEQVADDDAFIATMERAHQRLNDYLSREGWFKRKFKDWNENEFIAYFSMEFGLTVSLPIYSGGLGILAGDHLKAASDLGLPLIAVGLFYQQGYFRQYLNADGWQQENYELNIAADLPLTPVVDGEGKRIKVELDMGPTKVIVVAHRVRVGRISLILLDTNIPENSEADRDITDALYSGGTEQRIKQEIVLGVGGTRMLVAMGTNPVVCHMNEGHAGFLALERVRLAMKNQGLDFSSAAEATKAGNVFTTHTPVPAGIDEFDAEMIEKYFGRYRKELGLELEEFMAFGRLGSSAARPAKDSVATRFNMAFLGMEFAGNINGVSELHGKVSRNMWSGNWAGVPKNEVPIGHVTNGIHLPSWVSAEMAELFDQYIGPHWFDEATDASLWERVERIPDEELWRTHERRREHLVAFARERLVAQLEARGESPHVVEKAREVLDPRALTIGFARRFATYKRATLLLSDHARLDRIVNNPDMPVQFVFAGKAHPADKEGKEFIRKLIHVIRDEKFRSRIVFVEDYDMHVARRMVQGVDVWLNNPRRPLEASGTSGMKVTPNGGLNLSILDGWWVEAFNGRNGWAIGRGEEWPDGNAVEQDAVESAGLYDALEKEVIPTFYSRTGDWLPRKWIRMMKNSMRSTCSFFTTDRMVREYTERFYVPAASTLHSLSANAHAAAKALALWKQFVRKNWTNVEIDTVGAVTPDGERLPNPGTHFDIDVSLEVGGNVRVEAIVRLGDIPPESVVVHVVTGPLDIHDRFESFSAIEMSFAQSVEKSRHLFRAEIPCFQSGKYGYTIRVLPRNQEIINLFEMGLIKWL